jgi:hypothetical protein
VRIIKIISDGNPIEVIDDDMEKSLDEVSEYVLNLMKSDKIVTLIGKDSSAIVRPSSISAINIIDIPDEKKTDHQKMIKPIEKPEQNNEHIDMIRDIDE